MWSICVANFFVPGMTRFIDHNTCLPMNLRNKLESLIKYRGSSHSVVSNSVGFEIVLFSFWSKFIQIVWINIVMIRNSVVFLANLCDLLCSSDSVDFGQYGIFFAQSRTLSEDHLYKNTCTKFLKNLYISYFSKLNGNSEAVIIICILWIRHHIHGD